MTLVGGFHWVASLVDRLYTCLTCILTLGLCSWRYPGESGPLATYPLGAAKAGPALLSGREVESIFIRGA